jgi:hypothetical protein
MKFRLAEEKDAAAISRMVAESGNQIDPNDIQLGLRKNNPTAVYFVVEREPDGVLIAFAPLVFVLHLCHLAFSQESRASEKIHAMQALLDGAVAFAEPYQVSRVQTLTVPAYGVAKWALAHGFVADDRTLLTLDTSKILDKNL